MNLATAKGRGAGVAGRWACHDRELPGCTVQHRGAKSNGFRDISSDAEQPLMGWSRLSLAQDSDIWTALWDSSEYRTSYNDGDT